MEYITQEWKLNNLTGGEGDGFFYGQRGDVRIASNIDLQKIESGVRIANEKIDGSNTYVGTILSVNPYEPFCFNTVSSGDVSNVYYNKVKVLEMSSSLAVAHRKIAGWGQMTKLSNNITYTYGFSYTDAGIGKIHRFDYGLTGYSSLTSTRTLGQGRTANPINTKMAVLSLPGRIVWAWGNTIYQITNSEVVTKLLELPKDVDIMEIVLYQDTYKVYYNWLKKGGQTDSYIAYWDGYDSAIDKYVKYENSPVRMVVNNGAYDYVVFGDGYTTDLYNVGGLNRGEPIIVNTEGDTNNNEREFGFVGLLREGTLYFTGEDKLGNSCIFSYGNYYAGSINRLSSVMPVNNYSLTFINANTTVLEIYDNGKIYTQSWFKLQKSAPQGLLYTYPLQGNYGIHTIKSIKSIEIAYELLHDDDSIKIYTRIDRGINVTNTTGWNLIYTITGADFKSKRGFKINHNIFTNSVDFFYMLEYKIELNRGLTYSPLLYSLKTEYEDNLK